MLYMGERYPVTVAVAGSTPLFDPDNERVKAAGANRGMRILVCVKRVPLTGGKMVLTRRRAGARDAPPRLHDQPARGVRRGAGGAARRAARRRGDRARAGTARGGGPDPRDARDRRRPRHPARDRRRGVGPAGDGGGDRGRGGRLRPGRLRQRVGRLRQLPGRHPGRPRARPAGGDRAQGPVDRGRAGALRAGGARRARRLRGAAARRGERARGHQPAPLPVGAGEAARAPEAGRDAHARAARSRASRSCGWWCRPGGQAGGDPGRGRRTRRRRSSA